MELHETVHAFQRLKRHETEPQPAGRDTTNASDADPPCRVIGFTGAKGGVGTTTVALNVAMTLVQGGQSVIYVELTPRVGTAASLLKVPQISALEDSSAHLDDMNRNFVIQLLMQHSTGLQVLCVSPWTKGVGSQISTEHLTALFRELRGLADYLVLDFPLEPSLPTMCFLTQCQILDLVMGTDSIFLALAKSQLEFIQRHSDTPICLTLVNRSGIPPADDLHGIQEQAGFAQPVIIPPAPELCHTASIKGMPIVCFNPNSMPALQFVKLSEQILSGFTEDRSEASRDRRDQERRKSDRRNRGGW